MEALRMLTDKKDEILIAGAAVSLLALTPQAIKVVKYYWSEAKARM